MLSQYYQSISPDPEAKPIIEKIEQRRKCGEIYVTEECTFDFFCMLCEESVFEEIERFIEHVKNCQFEINENISNLELHPEDPLESDTEYKFLNSLNEETENVPDQCNNEDFECIKEETEDTKTLAIENVCSESTSEKNLTSTSKETEHVLDGTKLQRKPKEIDRDKNSFSCDCCNRTYALKSSLRRHIREKHPKTIPDVGEQVFSKNPDDYRLVTVKPIISEMSLELNDDDSPKGESVDQEKIVIETLAYLDNKTCRYCNRQFSNKCMRDRHEAIHSIEKRYKCETCNKRYRHYTTYRRHLSIHLNKKKYKCNLCSIGFNERSNLIVHIKRHNGVKAVKCRYCEKRFVVTSERKMHERIHTGEKPYRCNVCGECFITSSRLGVHRRKHAGEGNFKCSYCDKTFFTQGCLNNHVIVHTGERPFVCNVCNKTFCRKKTLKCHEKIHSGVRGYVCETCGSSFKQRSGLYAHKKIHGQPITVSKID